MSLKEGVDHFNAGRFWKAHESWEHVWLKLDGSEKVRLQAFIQAAGAFHLGQTEGRLSGAVSLAESALRKFEESRNSPFQTKGLIGCDGLEDCLRQMISDRKAGKIPPARLL